VWKRLRENYRKAVSKRKLLSKSGSGGGESLPTCGYFESLSFLSDTIGNRQTSSNNNISTISSHPSSQITMNTPIRNQHQENFSFSTNTLINRSQQRENVSLSSTSVFPINTNQASTSPPVSTNSLYNTQATPSC